MDIIDKISKLNNEKYRCDCPTCFAEKQLITLPCNQCGANLPKHYIDKAREETEIAQRKLDEPNETAKDHLRALSARIESLEVQLELERTENHGLRKDINEKLTDLINTALQAENELNK